MATVGVRLRQLRKLAGLTQVELGARLGVTGATISGYETEEHHFIADELPRFADALSVHPCSFFDAAPPPSALGGAEGSGYTPTLGDELGAEELRFLTSMNPKRRALLMGMARLLDEQGIE